MNFSTSSRNSLSGSIQTKQRSERKCSTRKEHYLLAKDDNDVRSADNNQMKMNLKKKFNFNTSISKIQKLCLRFIKQKMGHQYS